MPRTLISRCLLGVPCRYDASAKPSIADALERMGILRSDLVDICPETDGGLSSPRLPCEIEPGCDGSDVLRGLARVRDQAGVDRTAAFIQGADSALKAAQANGIRIALLKAKSPSCGVRFIYDGTFHSRLKPGKGVCAALLSQAGISCFCEDELEGLAAAFRGNSVK